MMSTISADLLDTVTGGDGSWMKELSAKVAPSDCNNELGFGGLLTGAELGLHAPGPWYLKMGVGAAAAIGGLYGGCRMGNRPAAAPAPAPSSK